MTLPAEVYALGAALFFALSNITLKRGFGNTSVLAGLIVSTGTGVLLLLVFTAIDPPSSITGPAFVAFLIAGAVGPGIGRAATTVGVDRLGAAVSVPLHASTYPIAASCVAMLFLGESMHIPQVLGLAVIVSGIWLITRRQAGGRIIPAVSRGTTSSHRVSSLLFPLIAGASYGLADIFQSRGVEALNEPIFGAMVGLTVGFVLWTACAYSTPTMRAGVLYGPGVKWFALSGLASALATAAIIQALQLGEVVVVSSIVATQPIIVLILSAIFLRDYEGFGPTVVAGAFVVTVGTMLVSA